MKAITAKVVGSAFVVVVLLTLFEYVTSSAVWFYLLYPGSALSLLITGGHGGTKFEEGAALAASLMTNTLAYAALGGVVVAIRRRDAVRSNGTPN
jgi:hypothetical protein